MYNFYPYNVFLAIANIAVQLKTGFVAQGCSEWYFRVGMGTETRYLIGFGAKL